MTKPKFEPKPELIIKGNSLHISHNFNGKLNLSCEKMKGISVLVFDEDLTNIKFSEFSRFNRRIILTSNIMELKLGWSFNQPIVLVPNIQILTFGDCFDQPIVLTRGIRHLTFGKNFNQPIVLTSNLTICTFGYCWNKPIILTLKLAIVKFGNCFNQPIILTHGLRVVIFGHRFNQPIVLSKNIVHLRFGIDFNKSIILTKNTIVLEFGYCFNQSIILTPKTTHLALGNFKQPIVLTSNIIALTMDCKNYNIFDNLSNSIKHLTCGCFLDRFPLNNIPSSLTKITINGNNYYSVHSIPKTFVEM